MKTFRIHYSVESHPHTLDVTAENASEARRKARENLIPRIHGSRPYRIVKTKLLRSQNA